MDLDCITKKAANKIRKKTEHDRKECKYESNKPHKIELKYNSSSPHSLASLLNFRESMREAF